MTKKIEHPCNTQPLKSEQTAQSRRQEPSTGEAPTVSIASPASPAPASSEIGDQDTIQDGKTVARKTAKKMPRQDSLSFEVSRPLSRQVSQPKSKTVSESPELTEEDLANQRERMLKTKSAREMLETGFTVRDVAEELKLPKGFVEKISKTIRREEVTASSARAENMARPYKYANEKLKKSEDDDESLLDSGWILKMQRKLMKMKIEQDMMKRMGLLGDDNNNGGAGKLDLQQLLLAKIVSGGESLGAKELTEFASALKNLFSPNSTQDPFGLSLSSPRFSRKVYRNTKKFPKKRMS